ncbi:MAG: hypothetical protein HYZ94_03150 [Candidatus Omnitrophica bacterium]|nr:hypothetical protein [Candidatus Omnitrophota bacterium]
MDGDRLKRAGMWMGASACLGMLLLVPLYLKPAAPPPAVEQEESQVWTGPLPKAEELGIVLPMDPPEPAEPAAPSPEEETDSGEQASVDEEIKRLQEMGIMTY